jgi:hypothetical protein
VSVLFSAVLQLLNLAGGLTRVRDGCGKRQLEDSEDQAIFQRKRGKDLYDYAIHTASGGKFG